MKVGIGYSDNPESKTAGQAAATAALANAGRTERCDIALLFGTARHDQAALREAVVAVTGAETPVYGGGTVGVITNDYFGYAGDQVGVICIWLDGVKCDVLVESGMNEGEEETGTRLGRKLADSGVRPDTPVLLFYDALDGSEGVRMLMATWLLTGIEKGLGFIPDLTGAGLMGDHICTPTQQWTGDGLSGFNTIALAFSGDVRMDSVIMHGCRPATGYYTVTKAHGPVILEINETPAIDFIDGLLGSAIAPEQYPFFLIFGINHGKRWGEYDEDYYASRLCLGIDRPSGGIVMFEPDMVEGTEFQLMFRSLEHTYIKPKIDRIFDELDGREPVFALYIDCAGRCAGYSGNDVEDAIYLQEAVAGRVPVLGLYTGVEIASIGGRPRGLDWTGVFCLFSQSGDRSSGSGESGGSEFGSESGNSGESGGRSGCGKAPHPVWEDSGAPTEASVEAMARLCESNAARFLALDASSITIRNELEQKRRGFSLLSELSVSLTQSPGYESVFVPVTRRINAALNMQRTAVLVSDGKGLFTAQVLQGYTAAEKAALAGKHIEVPPELLDTTESVIITGADSAGKYGELRALLGIPFFVSSPVVLQSKVYAILITGRLMESIPYLVRLSRSDMETVKAISALLASVLAGQHLAASEERNRIMIDAAPVCCMLWDETGVLSDCNNETLALFGLASKEEFTENFARLSPERQPDGSLSEKAIIKHVRKTFISGEDRFNWMHCTLDGEPIPTEIALIRMPKREDYIITGYIFDLREQEATQAKLKEAHELAERHIKAKNEFLASVSHEIRTPMNAIQAMARVAENAMGITETQSNILNQGKYAITLLTSVIETILDFSKLDSGRISLEIKEYSIRNLINMIIGMVSNDAKTKDLQLNATVGAGIPDMLMGDEARLQQVIFNVVVNAVKFTNTGSVTVNVYCDDRDNDSGIHGGIHGGNTAFAAHDKTGSDNRLTLIIEVTDTGIGITGEQIIDLFKPLYTADMSYGRKYGGIGMGLPVSSGLAALMGGKITCESVPGEGSTFRIVIPQGIAARHAETTSADAGAVASAGSETAAAAAQVAPRGPDTSLLSGLHVLVVEDNVINQMIMEELLSSVGIKVTLADNGLEAIKKLQKSTFNLILMDIQMPEMDGLTATAQIRTDQRFANLPILAMTANSAIEHYDESIKAGMNDYLTKPVNTEQLYNALIKWTR